MKPKVLVAFACYGGAILYLITRLITVRKRIRRQAAADGMRWENEGGLVAAGDGDLHPLPQRSTFTPS